MRIAMTRSLLRIVGSVALIASVLSCAHRSLPVTPPGTIAQSAAAASAAPSYPGYSLAWAEEFDGTGNPDPKNWRYERGFVRNEELQWYQPENARRADGVLVIEARRAGSRTPIERFNDAAWSSAFHIWRMDWDERAIVLSVDGETLNEVDLTKTVNQDGSAINPFHQPHYLILNLAVGGTQGGDPAQTTFPARYEIDYVRVYQRPPAKEP